MKANLYLDLHVLQTVPPSCVNRDDTGSPKTALYGGVTRARVSSQAWKRAMRLMFQDLLEPEQCGIRTKHLPEELGKRISMQDPSAKADKLAVEILKRSGIGLKEKEQKTDALFFASRKQLDALAELALRGEKDSKEQERACKLVLKEHPSIDLALFGRMVASKGKEAGGPSLNYDAAAQVAHSISTHAVHNEYDYFTAVDDCSPEDNAGAAHLGTVEFNSSTLYRYATVNLCELNVHLGQDTPCAARCFAEAFIRSMPTGKQNTFANRTLPDLVYAALRPDQPVNLCGAFEKPVSAGKMGFARPSVEALVQYAQQVYQAFVPAPEMAWVVGVHPVPEEFAKRETLSELLRDVEGRVKAALEDGVV